MHLKKALGLLLLFYWGFFGQGVANSKVDSLLTERENKFKAYQTFKDNMKTRSWLNLVELGKKAEEVINLDNMLVNDYLENELNKNADLKTSIEKLSLEMALLHKEAEVRGVLLNEKKEQANTLIIILISVSIALILAVIFLIDRHKRFKLTLMELERLWSSAGDTAMENEIKELKEQINNLTQENNKYRKELIILDDQKKDARKKLEEEIRSRRIMEDEIKNLIGQLKKK